VDLARAYVAVLQVPRADTLRTSHRVDHEVACVFLPPMVLLPLTQAAFAREDADVRSGYAIDAEPSGKGATITISVEGGRFPPAWRDDGPEGARRTLHAYFADKATVEFGSDSACHWARIILAPQAVAAAGSEPQNQSPFDSMRGAIQSARA